MPAGAQNDPYVGTREGFCRGVISCWGDFKDLHGGPPSFVLKVLLADASIDSYFMIMGREVVF